MRHMNIVIHIAVSEQQLALQIGRQPCVVLTGIPARMFLVGQSLEPIAPCRNVGPLIVIAGPETATE